MATQLNSDGNGLWAQQDKDAFLDYSIDWTDWLAQSPGDTINTSTWAADVALTLNTPGVVGSVASVWVQGGVAFTWYVITNTVTSTQGRRDQRSIRIYIVDEASSAGSALFPNRALAIAKVRRDRLAVAASGAFPSIDVSDDYIWDKLVSAESEMSHRLRVAFEPTRYFPFEPTQAQIDALNGQAWEVESAPDYEAQMFSGDRWGYIVTRQKPIIAVRQMRFVYPTENNGYFEIPLQWLSIDKKYGHIRIVPTSNAVLTGLAGMVMMNLAGGRTIPSMIHLEYDAGLTDVAKKWPELIDVVQKVAVLKIIEDAFLPQSGSISADGLSQSMSIDMSKYHDSVDSIVNGTDGNGGLQAKIHGIRMLVL